MNPVVCIQLRMKGHSKLVSAAHRHNVPIHLSQHLCTCFCFFYIRSTYERHGNLPDSGKFLHGMETSQLSSVGIATHRNRKCAKIHMSIIGELICQKDESGTGTEDRHATLDFFFQRIKHVKLPQKLSLDRALATRKHKTVKSGVQVLLLTKLKAFCSKSPQLFLVFDEGTLNCKDCNLHLICPFLPSAAQFPAH